MMSSYNGGRSNRISMDSVAFSTKPYVVKSEDILGENFLTEEEKAKKVKKNELEEKELVLRNYEMQLKETQAELEKQFEKFFSVWRPLFQG